MTVKEETTRPGGLSRRDVAGALVAVNLAGIGHAAAQEATPQATLPVPPDFKVVLHASSPTHWPYVLSNLDNLNQQWPKARIRVVVDGTAVYGLQEKTDVTAKLEQATTTGVEIEVCPNALHEHEIDPSTIPRFAKITLGGVVALVAAQHAGYAYIKPC